MFIKKKNILKETNSFVFSITFSKKEKTYSTSGVFSQTTIPVGTPSVRLYFKKKFLGITYYKFIIGIKFKHQIYRSMYAFGGNQSPKIPLEKLFKKVTENDARSIYHQKPNDDKYLVEYNNTENIYNDLAWMVAYQVFWENEPAYRNFGTIVNDDQLNLLNTELNLNLCYIRSTNILKGNIIFEREAYHMHNKQEDYFYNMMMSDRRNIKIKSIINS